MITDKEIVGAALTAGFMLSTQCRQGERQMMPVSDTATLREFAREIERISRQHQRESDAVFVDHILREGGGTYGDIIRKNTGEPK